MREILFRGKGKRDGKWVEGGIIQGVSHELWQNEDRVYIMVFPKYLSTPNLCEVDPTTVGQYTGLNDKNGQRIFEGDVFEWGYCGVKEFRYVVAYDAWLAAFVGERHFGFVSLNGVDIEIIGNIHDNPELLEEVKCDG